MRKAFAIFVWACLLLGSLASVTRAGVAPGTSIDNQAGASYFSAAGRTTTSISNTVQVITAIGPAGSNLTLTKAVSTPTANAGDSLTFTLTAANVGAGDAAPVTVAIDGTNVNKIVVRDVIPDNTKFASFVAWGGSTPLYHLYGAATPNYVTAAPSDLSTIDAVAFALDAFPSGANASFKFSVTLNSNAAGTISNTGAVYSNNGSDISTPSNTVVVTASGSGPIIGFFTNGGFSRPAPVGSAGQPLYIQANAARCNTNPGVPDTVQITVSASLSGDLETFTATETGPNTGLFQVLPAPATLNASSSPVVQGDRIMEVQSGDTVTAVLKGCGSTSVNATLLIDPSGVVFDSHSNQPVAGATVTLLDVTGQGNGGNPGQPATVLTADGVTPAASTVTTASDGRFTFLYVLPSTYKFSVAPPGFTYPSTIATGQLPAGHAVDANASYGKSFVITTAGPVRFDQPVDLKGTGLLLVEKSAARSTALIGDFLDYTIQVKNTSPIVFNNVQVSDTLPRGFAYQLRTTRVNAAVAPDPAGGRGPNLVFTLATLSANSELDITYRVQVGATAGMGANPNFAIATAGTTKSNSASATVLVLGGAFSNEGYVIGRVFADCNGNGKLDPDESGIPGVRVLLEDQTSATTDIQGKYSIYGVTPLTHMVKIDPLTLPVGYEGEILNHRNAGDPNSMFVDMKNGQMFRADFATACSAKLISEIAERGKKGKQGFVEAEAGLGANFTYDTIRRGTVEAKAAPSAGIVGHVPVSEESPMGPSLSGTAGPAGSSTTPPTATPGAPADLKSTSPSAQPEGVTAAPSAGIVGHVPVTENSPTETSLPGTAGAASSSSAPSPAIPSAPAEPKSTTPSAQPEEAKAAPSAGIVGHVPVAEDGPTGTSLPGTANPANGSSAPSAGTPSESADLKSTSPSAQPEAANAAPSPGIVGHVPAAEESPTGASQPGTAGPAGSSSAASAATPSGSADLKSTSPSAQPEAAHAAPSAGIVGHIPAAEESPTGASQPGATGPASSSSTPSAATPSAPAEPKSITPSTHPEEARSGSQPVSSLIEFGRHPLEPPETLLPGQVNETVIYPFDTLNACVGSSIQTAVLHDLGLFDPASAPVSVALASIFYPTNYPRRANPKIGLVPSERAMLSELAANFKSYAQYDSTATLLIVGHADSRGAKRHNVGLRQRRANLTKEVLISLGAPAERIETRADGASKPLNRKEVVSLLSSNPRKAPDYMTRRLAATILAYNRRVDIDLEPAGKESARTYPYASPDALILWQPSMPSTKAVMGANLNFPAATAGNSESNTTAATKMVPGGTFRNEGFVIGDAFNDCSGPAKPDLDEPGIFGVRLLPEDQTSRTMGAKTALSAGSVGHIPDVKKFPVEAFLAEMPDSTTSSSTDFTAAPRAPADPESTTAPAEPVVGRTWPSAGVAGHVTGAREFPTEAFLAEPADSASSSFTWSTASLRAPADPQSTTPLAQPVEVGTVPSAAIVGHVTDARKFPTEAAMVKTVDSATNSSRESTATSPAPAGPESTMPPAQTAEVQTTPLAEIAGQIPGVEKSLTEGFLAERADSATTSSTGPSVAPSAPADPKFDTPPAQPEITKSEKQPVSPLIEVGEQPLEPLETLLPQLEPVLGFINVKDNQVMPYTQTPVRVKGPVGSAFKLYVNDVEVGDKQVGKKVIDPEHQVEAWEFIGVDLKPGHNSLRLVQLDPFGNPRASSLITLIAPKPLRKFRIDLPKQADADGKTLVKIAVHPLDADDVPVMVPVEITVESSDGEWQLKDIDPSQPGIQVYVKGGEAILPLLPPLDSGTAKIRITSGTVHSEAQLAFVPALRPMIAAGVVDEVLSFRNFSGNSIAAVQANDGFEEELRALSISNANDTTQLQSHVGLSLKGKVLGSYLLTLAYDSDKSNERLFRDIQPDEFYPVYGDSSVRGYDAQSTSRAYLRVDKGRSYILYGDFATTENDSTRVLTVYNRSLTGMREHFQNDRVNVTTFASHDSFAQHIQEIPANGTSGPYILSNSTGVINGETVQIVVRDRNQPAVILKITPATRFVDYEFEPYSGEILFTSPIPSLDQNLDPVSIRVTYEMDQGGPRFWVAGLDGSVKLDDRVRVGATYVADLNPGDQFFMEGFNSSINLDSHTTLNGEFARTHQDTVGDGDGYHFELLHESEKLKARAYFGRTTATFDNINSLLNQGRGEGGLKLSWNFNPSTRLVADAIRSEDTGAGGTQVGALVGVEHTLKNRAQVEVGMRYVEQGNLAASPSTEGSTNTATTSVRAKLTVPVPHLARLRVYGEYEQDVRDLDKKIAAIGGTFQLFEHAKIYARRELISSLGNQFSLNSAQQEQATVVGIDGDYAKNTRVFSEYRDRDDFSGRETEAAIGLRNTWAVLPGLRLISGVESVKVLKGVDATNNLAFTSGADYTPNTRFKGTSRFEWRASSNTRGYLSTLGAAVKISQNWTFLGRNVVSTENSTSGPQNDQFRERGQMGFAFRDSATSSWNWLAMTEFRSERTLNTTAPTARRFVVLSSNVNYEPFRSLVLSGRYASKFTVDKSLGLDSSAGDQLASLRLTYDLAKHWDMGFLASTMFSNGFSSRQYSMGPELGRLLTRNLWGSVGYNVLGYHDTDLSGENQMRRGTYVRLRFKFDEALLEKIPGANSK